MSARALEQLRSPSLPPPVSLRRHPGLDEGPGPADARSPSLPPPVSIPHFSFSNAPDPPQFQRGDETEVQMGDQSVELSSLKIEDLSDGRRTTTFERAMAALDAARRSRDSFFQAHVLDNVAGSEVGGPETLVPPNAKEMMNYLATELVSTASLLDDSRKELTREKAYSESLKVELTKLEEQLDEGVMEKTTGGGPSFGQETSASDEEALSRRQAQRISPEPHDLHSSPAKPVECADASTQITWPETHGREQEGEQKRCQEAGCQSHDVESAVARIQLSFRNRHMRNNTRILRERERRWEDERRAKTQHFLREIVEQKRQSQRMVEQAAEALEKSRSENLQSKLTTEADLVEAFNLGHEPAPEEEEPRAQKGCFPGFSRKAKRDDGGDKLRAQRARYEENVNAFRRIVSRLQDESRQQQSKTESLVPQVLGLRQLVLKAWQAGERAFALLEEVGIGRDGREQQQVVELQRAMTALEFRAAEHKDIAKQIQVQWDTDVQTLQTDMKRLSTDGRWARQRAEKAEEALEAARTQISFLEAKKGSEGEVLALKQERQELRATSAALNATLSLYQEEVKRLSAAILESQLTGSPASLRASSRGWRVPLEGGDTFFASQDGGGSKSQGHGLRPKGIASHVTSHVSDGRLTMSDAVMGSWKPLRVPSSKMASKHKSGSAWNAFNSSAGGHPEGSEGEAERSAEEEMSSRLHQQLEGQMNSLQDAMDQFNPAWTQELSQNARFRKASTARGSCASSRAFGTSDVLFRPRRSRSPQRSRNFYSSAVQDGSPLSLATQSLKASQRQHADASSPSPEKISIPSISVTLTIVHAQNLPGGETALADPFFCTEMDGIKMQTSILQSPGGLRTGGIEPRKYCARARPSSTIRLVLHHPFEGRGKARLRIRATAEVAMKSMLPAGWRDGNAEEEFWHKDWYTLHDRNGAPLVGPEGGITALQILVMIEVKARRENESLERSRRSLDSRPYAQHAASVSVSPSPPASPEQPISAEEI